MPQKKNPDGFEIIRSKAAVASGRLSTMQGVIKGLAMSYNKDLQEDKALMYGAFKDMSLILSLLPEMIKTTTFNTAIMKKAVEEGFCNATELADALVKRGVPFREAHHIVGSIVAVAQKQAKKLEDLPLETYKNISPAFDTWVYQCLDYQTALNNKSSEGSTAETSVLRHIKILKNWLSTVG